MTDLQNRIKAFFEDHHGEIIYPSRIMLDLGLDDYDAIEAACLVLVENGKIKEVKPPYEEIAYAHE